jgi:hypothetical protein
MSGMGLVRLTAEDWGPEGSSNQESTEPNATPFSNDRLMFRNILAELVEFSSREVGVGSNYSPSTPTSPQLSTPDLIPSRKQSIREVLDQPSPTRPSFVDEDIWSLLVEMCNEESVTWKHIIHKIDLLAQQERSQDSTSDRHPDEVIESLEKFTFDGLSVKMMLDEADSFCTDLKELRTVNQPVLARLVNIYEQLHRCEAPLKRFVVEDFCLIIGRFNAQLDRRAYSSQVASACAS